MTDYCQKKTDERQIKRTAMFVTCAMSRDVRVCVGVCGVGVYSAASIHTTPCVCVCVSVCSRRCRCVSSVTSYVN